MVYFTGGLLLWTLAWLWAIQDVWQSLEEVMRKDDPDLPLQAKLALKRLPRITVGAILLSLLVVWPVLAWRKLRFYFRWVQLVYEDWKLKRRIRRLEENIDPIPEEYAQEVDIHVE